MTRNRLNGGRTGRVWRRIAHGQMTRIPLLCLAALALAPPGFAQVGRLGIGDWALSGQTLTVPVILDGDVGEGISALDFRIVYDPDVFEPTAIRAGAAALRANKLINANVITPGEYIVLLFGMNRTTLTGGVVAIVDFQVLGPPESGTTRISVENTTLSGPGAGDVLSRGTSRSLLFDGDLPRPARPSPAQRPDEEASESDNDGSGANGPGNDDADDAENDDAEPPPVRFGGAITPWPPMHDGGTPGPAGNQPAPPAQAGAEKGSAGRANALLDRMRKVDELRAQLPAVGLGEGEEADSVGPAAVVATALQSGTSVATAPAPEGVAQVRRPARRRLEGGSVSATQQPEPDAQPTESEALPSGSTGESQGVWSRAIALAIAAVLLAAVFAIRKIVLR